MSLGDSLLFCKQAKTTLAEYYQRRASAKYQVPLFVYFALNHPDCRMECLQYSVLQRCSFRWDAQKKASMIPLTFAVLATAGPGATTLSIKADEFTWKKLKGLAEHTTLPEANAFLVDLIVFGFKRQMNY